MGIIKKSGDVPGFATEQRRDVRQGLREVDRMRQRDTIAEAKRITSADALEEMQQMAASGEDVRSLTPEAYAARKRTMRTLLRRVGNPRP